MKSEPSKFSYCDMLIKNYPQPEFTKFKNYNWIRFDLIWFD